jgi:hypothetical protein
MRKKKRIRKEEAWKNEEETRKNEEDTRQNEDVAGIRMKNIHAKMRKRKWNQEE